MPQYDVTIANLIEADTPQDAVRLMVADPRIDPRVRIINIEEVD